MAWVALLIFLFLHTKQFCNIWLWEEFTFPWFHSLRAESQQSERKKWPWLWDQKQYLKHSLIHVLETPWQINYNCLLWRLRGSVFYTIGSDLAEIVSFCDTITHYLFSHLNCTFGCHLRFWIKVYINERYHNSISHFPELIYKSKKKKKDKAKTLFVLRKVCHLHLAYEIQLGTKF